LTAETQPSLMLIRATNPSLGSIRPFVQADIGQVADLAWNVLDRQTGPSPSKLQLYFHELYFNNPWLDETLPSLVFEDVAHNIVGFLGAIPRPMRWQTRAIRAVYGSTLVVAPRSRATLAGIYLTQQFLAGNQDIALSDTANDLSRKLWMLSGGSTALLYSLHWARPLQPVQYALHSWLRLKKRQLPACLRAAANPVCKLLDLAVRPAACPLPHDRSGLEARVLDSCLLLECLAEFVSANLLRTQYDLASLSWLLDFMANRKAHGELHKKAIFSPGKQLVGWYIFFVNTGGAAEVVQVGARRKWMGPVLDHLFSYARCCGAIAVHGRFEPAYADELRERCAFFYRRGSWLLVHSKDRDLQQQIMNGNASLTRLDGEWCLGHSGAHD
jgi:hypothetical protein